jgi:hypothetical protein
LISRGRPETTVLASIILHTFLNSVQAHLPLHIFTTLTSWQSLCLMHEWTLDDLTKIGKGRCSTLSTVDTRGWPSLYHQYGPSPLLKSLEGLGTIALIRQEGAVTLFVYEIIDFQEKNRPFRRWYKASIKCDAWLMRTSEF